MRLPDLNIDGWALDDGEDYHRAAPETFSIPSEEARRNLKIGDLAKLIFRISVESDDESEPVERMWVLVREITEQGYYGVLDNEPTSIDPNDEFWLGAELPFEARHVIDIDLADEKTFSFAAEPPRRRWAR